MEYVATNIRLPRPLWLQLKRVAAEQGKRMAVVIREWLERGLAAQQQQPVNASGTTSPHNDPLCGLLPAQTVPDTVLKDAKRIFTPRMPRA